MVLPAQAVHRVHAALLYQVKDFYIPTVQIIVDPPVCVRQRCRTLGECVEPFYPVLSKRCVRGTSRRTGFKCRYLNSSDHMHVFFLIRYVYEKKAGVCDQKPISPATRSFNQRHV